MTRPAGQARSLAKMGVVVDVWTDGVVEGGQETGVLDAVLLHPSLCPLVAVHYCRPETEALVLDLAADLKIGTNEGETVHNEAHLLHCLQEIDTCDRGRRRQPSHKEFTHSLLVVVSVAVIGDDCCLLYTSPSPRDA